MMREEESSGTGTDEAKAGGRGSVLVAAVVLLVSAAVGSAVGMGVIGPRVASPAAASADHDAAGPTRPGKGHGDAARLYAIESLVVNPSGTAGMRFLIATVTVEMDDVKSLELLKARDAAARDALLHVLGSKTVEALSDVAARDSLKLELSAAIAGVIGEKRVRTLFLPQFVLQ